MNSITKHPSNKSVTNASTSRALPAWWLVFTRELVDLWIGGKAFNLILIYSILLGVMVYVYSFNTELSLIPPKEAVYEMLKNAMAVSMFVGLIIGADSLSGERERATLESVLLTPTSRQQIVVGKFLAGASSWPLAFIIAIPFLYVLSQGDEVLGPAIFWGAVTGTVMVLAFTGLGMLISCWSSSNKVSYFVSLGVYVLLLVPAELPGKSAGAAGQFLQWINPMAGVNHFLSKHLVNYRTLAEFWTWLIPPAVSFIIILGLLFLYAGPRLRLEGGRPSKLWVRVSRALGLAVLVISLIASPGVSLAHTFDELQPQASDLQITIDMEYKQVKTGDKVEFNTTVTNASAQDSPPLIVAMNIINLDASGDVVDPEDWSPQRTQYLESLTSGDAAELHWIINTILEGDYMVYMVLIPAPGTATSTSQPVASPGIHLTVAPFTRLNPAGVLPYAIGIPGVILIAILIMYRIRRRSIDMGGP